MLLSLETTNNLDCGYRDVSSYKANYTNELARLPNRKHGIERQRCGDCRTRSHQAATVGKTKSCCLEGEPFEVELTVTDVNPELVGNDAVEWTNACRATIRTKSSGTA